MIFKCRMLVEGGTETWEGCIASFSKYGSHYEMRIESRSGIRVIFGKTTCGNFACIPDFNAGCHLSNLKDRFWNAEKLCEAIGTVDGLTVAYALAAVADKLE